MALKIIIPGADFSALGNPKVEDFVEGVPAAGLAALYMFDTGTLCQPYAGPAKDYSGSGADAPLIGGSTALKTAGGVSNVADGTAPGNNGFGVLSPVAISPKFTVFGVSRNLFPITAGATPFLMPWSSSGNWNAPAAPVVTDAFSGSASSGTDGRLHVNQSNTANNDYAEIAALSTKYNASGTGWGGGSTRTGVTSTGQPKASWIAWALSFDSTYGAIFRALGGGIVAASATDAATWSAGQIGRGARHMFGAMNYQMNASGVKGEMAMAGIYNAVAKSAADMDALIAQLKARMLARGLTAL